MSTEAPEEENYQIPFDYYMTTMYQHPTLIFDGRTKDSDELEEFIQDMKLHMGLMLWRNEASRIVYFKRHLTGPAEKWANEHIREVGVENVSFNGLVESVRKEFYLRKGRRILDTISQLSEAKLGIARLNQKFKECCEQFPDGYMSEQDIMIVYYRLLKHDTQTAIHLSKPTTLKESMEVAYQGVAPVDYIMNTMSQLSEAKLGIKRLNQKFRECWKELPESYMSEQAKMDIYYRLLKPTTWIAIHLSDPATLEEAMKVASQAMAFLKRRCAEVGISEANIKSLDDSGMTFSEPFGSQNRKTKRPRYQERPRFSKQPKIPSKEDCLKQDLCFYCKKTGHRLHECRLRKARPNRRES